MSDETDAEQPGRGIEQPPHAGGVQPAVAGSEVLCESARPGLAPESPHDLMTSSQSLQDRRRQVPRLPRFVVVLGQPERNQMPEAGEVSAISEEVTPLLIINNSHYLLDDALKNVLTIKNIITAAGTEQIKNFQPCITRRGQPKLNYR